MQTQKFFHKHAHGDLPAKFCPSKVLYYTVVDQEEQASKGGYIHKV